VTDRYRQLLTLLHLRFDRTFDYDGLRDSLASLKTKRGEGPSKRVPCPDCGGEGMKRHRGIGYGCERCGGSGRPLEFLADPDGDTEVTSGTIKARGRTLGLGRGWIEVDDYTGRSISTIEAPQPRPTKSVLCDGCGGTGYSPKTGDRRCFYCDGTGRCDVALNLLPTRQSTQPRKEMTPMERAAEERGRYSLPELEECLRTLRVLHGAWYRALLIELGFVEGTLVLRSNFDKAMAFLDQSMPAELKLPRFDPRADPTGQRRQPGKGRWANGSAQKERDAKIKAMKEEGHPVAMIAMRFGIARSTVYEIIGKTNGDEVAA
jgi:hypothetical protein